MTSRAISIYSGGVYHSFSPVPSARWLSAGVSGNASVMIAHQLPKVSKALDTYS